MAPPVPNHYREWLKLPASPRDYFELLGVPPETDDAQVIQRAATVSRERLEQVPISARTAEWFKLQTLIEQAESCLTNSDRRTHYVAQRKARAAQRSHGTPETQRSHGTPETQRSHGTPEAQRAKQTHTFTPPVQVSSPESSSATFERPNTADGRQVPQAVVTLRGSSAQDSEERVATRSDVSSVASTAPSKLADIDPMAPVPWAQSTAPTAAPIGTTHDSRSTVAPPPISSASPPAPIILQRPARGPRRRTPHRTVSHQRTLLWAWVSATLAFGITAVTAGLLIMRSVERSTSDLSPSTSSPKQARDLPLPESAQRPVAVAVEPAPTVPPSKSTIDAVADASTAGNTQASTPDDSPLATADPNIHADTDTSGDRPPGASSSEVVSESLATESPSPTPQQPDMASLATDPTSMTDGSQDGESDTLVTSSAEREPRARRALRDARRALEQRELDDSRLALRRAEDLAQGTSLESATERLSNLAHYVEEFWKAADAALENAEGSELTIGDQVTMIVSVTPDLLVLRVQGQNQRYTRKRLPTKIALALADRWLKPESASTPLIRGAFLAVSPNPPQQLVRDLWRQAAEQGADVGDLPQVLDDQYDERTQ